LFRASRFARLVSLYQEPGSLLEIRPVGTNIAREMSESRIQGILMACLPACLGDCAAKSAIVYLVPMI
jgi:hypothetical protein